MQSSCKSYSIASAWRLSCVWRLLLLGGQHEEFLPQMLNLIESAKGAAKLEIVTAFVTEILNLPETMPSRQDLLKAAVESGNDLLNSWSLTSKVQHANLNWMLNQHMQSGATCFRPWGMFFKLSYLATFGKKQQELLRIRTRTSCPLYLEGSAIVPFSKRCLEATTVALQSQSWQWATVNCQAHALWEIWFWCSRWKGPAWRLCFQCCTCKVYAKAHLIPWVEPK